LLSDRIIQFRTYNNIEPETVAKVLNIDLDEYLKFEDGSATPDIALISELAKIYKVTINEFYGHTPRLALYNKTSSDEDEKFKKALDDLKFSELSVDEKELILTYRKNQNKEKFFKLLEEAEK
jgi:transcriptional regulator with XRE-family HTH domain